jgi:3-polyprenyl-4-hydroxybenzoate decarboxylase and related decarboxylases
MEYQDLRDWIQIADEMGELKTLKGCDWNLEIGAITEIVAHKEDGPAVLFEDIKGYPKGLSRTIQLAFIAQAIGSYAGASCGRNQNGFRQDLERQL